MKQVFSVIKSDLIVPNVPLVMFAKAKIELFLLPH